MVASSNSVCRLQIHFEIVKSRALIDKFTDEIAKNSDILRFAPVKFILRRRSRLARTPPSRRSMTERFARLVEKKTRRTVEIFPFSSLPFGNDL
jgi:hypothetical protein